MQQAVNAMRHEKRICILIIEIHELFFFLPRGTDLLQEYIGKKKLSVSLSSFSINLPAFYHECRSLIRYATH